MNLFRHSFARRIALALLAVAPAAKAAVVVSGFAFAPGVVVAGAPLSMNGVGWRQHGPVRIDATALYTQKHASSVDELERLPGVKRVELVMLVDVDGSMASRAFLADFEAAASQAEFGQLINEVAAFGALYSALPRLRKGDVVTMDIVPGKGIAGELTGRPMVPPGSASRYLGSDLKGRVLLRMYVGARTPPELRDNLLGLSTSMQHEAAAASR